ncbi:MAG: type II toxin-antitoxin system RelE/ParE family toxin [Sporomusaceae bacterium]|jgi:addiction module RelE/StbE family toxin|nr:type II toxin-antitoxin system RelE/ParE family toxin [Sporomusaceae bacterium]
MEEYKIKIFPAAQNDLREIVDYLNTFSRETALKYYDLIIEKINTLKKMPERCPLLKDSQLRLRGYRTLLLENYIVFYVINRDTIEIRRILFAKRQYKWLL